jgi:hypothetical protein
MDNFTIEQLLMLDLATTLGNKKRYNQKLTSLEKKFLKQNKNEYISI